MSDYIEREAAIAYIHEQSEECQKAFEELGGESGIYADAYNDLAEDFYRIPAADVAPVRHGRWDAIPNKYIAVASKTGAYYGNATACSVCHEVNPSAFKTNYCPNCGAKMIGG